MGGWTLTPSDVITGLLGVCVALLTFFGKKYVDKLDMLDAEAVRKHDLKEIEERMEVRGDWMHEQNQKSLGDLNANVSNMGARIDQLLRDMSNRGGRP